MTNVPRDMLRINASPTKEFFIYMLTRDIPLTRAILDLVDNAVDGARRTRPDEAAFNDLWVRIELDAGHFKIADNCGGISVDVARTYAFRFGRPNEVPLTPGSVGQFGVGMKRTFFKLGRHFSVVSATPSSRFRIDIDVDEWQGPGGAQRPPSREQGGTSERVDADPAGVNQVEDEQADEWHFAFSTAEEGLSGVAAEEVGTRIEIDRLYGPVSESFALDNFVTRLKHEIALAHSVSMDRGLAISVNGIPLRHDPQVLFVSDTLKPAFTEIAFQGEGATAQIRVKLYAGVAERKLHEGGWYVFCNGRLVLRADQTATTIWQQDGVRRYHADFAFFRGYAYFDSDDASLLPWTTTKTGVDVDFPIYRSIQQEMIEISKPVLTFLSHLAKEKAAKENGDETDGAFEKAMSATATQLRELAPTPFVAPVPKPIVRGPRMQKIQYSKLLTEVERAKSLLKVQTFAAVGEKTFEYYMHYEDDK